MVAFPCNQFGQQVRTLICVYSDDCDEKPCLLSCLVWSLSCGKSLTMIATHVCVCVLYVKENGTNAEIKEFAKSKHATFPLMDKIDVNGDDAMSLYKAMKEITGGGDVKWNFEKFLVSQEGRVVRRYVLLYIPYTPPTQVFLIPSPPSFSLSLHFCSFTQRICTDSDEYRRMLIRVY